MSQDNESGNESAGPPVGSGRHRAPTRGFLPRVRDWARRRGAAARRRVPSGRAWFTSPALAAGSAAVLVAALAVTLVVTQVLPGSSPSGGSQPFVADFADDRRLVTNELAYREPDTDGAHVSEDWLVTSGSLFARDGVGWTGQPDRESPNAESSNGTGSAVFRAVTRRDDFRDVRVHFQLRVHDFVTTEETPAEDYDGVHVFLRYQNDRHLYAVSVNRRDDTVVIKKKVPGGSANGGSYTTLAQAEHEFPRDEWVGVEVSVRNLTGDGASEDAGVRIGLALDGQGVLQATDRGSGGEPPIGDAGRVGLRGDNTEFTFREFVVRPLER